MTYLVEWETDYPEFTDEQIKNIESELAYISNQVDNPADLMFHHVWLTDDMNGPVVMIYGKDNDNDTFYMSYYETSEWTTLEDDDALEV